MKNLFGILMLTFATTSAVISTPVAAETDGNG
jgi:hypothetical protein